MNSIFRISLSDGYKFSPNFATTSFIVLGLPRVVLMQQVVTRFLLAPRSATLDDTEQVLRTLLQKNMHPFGAQQENLNL